MDSMLSLAAATALLVMVPGPNVALIVAISLRYGRRQGLAAVAGTTCGVALQLVLVVAGLTALITRVAAALMWIKWCGVVLLLIMGVAAWRNRGDQARGAETPAKLRAFWQGVLIATLNPKTLLFNAAFLPQFIAAADEAAARLPLLAGIYLLVIALGDTLWVLSANLLRSRLPANAGLRRRVSGTCLLGAGTVLALARGRS